MSTKPGELQLQEWRQAPSATLLQDALGKLDEIGEARTTAQSLTDDREVEARLSEVVELASRYREVMRSAAAAHAAGRPTAPALSELDTISPRALDLIDVVQTAVGTRQETLGVQAVTNFERIALILTVAAAICLIVGLGAAFYLARLVTSGIGRIISAMEAIRDGDYTTKLVDEGRTDEIGRMADTLAGFRDDLAAAAVEREDRAEADRRMAERRRAERLAMADAFERSVKQSVSVVSSGSSQTQAAADQMSRLAESSEEEASTTASASEKASASVQSVASAAEELSASIGEIARQIGESGVRINAAVDKTRQTDGTMRGLSEAATRIGDVVSLISGIAEQTNLLALNATFEAARAGEAGKGFAVVAAEVKQLATQTAKATDEIAQQINAIQSETGEAVEAMTAIVSAFEDVNQISSAIAAAVQEQSAATNEIAGNVQQASLGTSMVSGTSQKLKDSASSTLAAARDVLTASRDVKGQASQLSEEVDRFLGEIRKEDDEEEADRAPAMAVAA